MGEIISLIFEKTLFELGGQSISLLWIFKLLIALLAVSIATRCLKSFLKYRLLSRLGIDGGNKEAIATLVSFGIGTFGYLIILQATGIDLSSLAVIIGGLGVGIGFGLQDFTKNLLSGLTILIERKLRVGDFVEFDEVAGYIEEIAIRSTVIRTLVGGEVIIPNSQLAEERITNWNYRDCTGRLEITVGVAYGSDPVLVTETLLEAAYSTPSVLREPSPKVIFEGFGDSALNFKLWFWIERIDLRAPIQSELTFAIEYYLRHRGITIPFPQLDLWMRSPNGAVEKPDINNQLNYFQTTVPEIAQTQTSQPVTKLAYTDTLKARLSQISYFQNFNELQIRNLIELGFRHQLEAGEVLVEQGETVREFCIVLSGEIQVFYKSESQQQYLRTFVAGEYFGELPLLLNLPVPGTLKANANTTLFVINKASFEKLLQDHPALAEDVAQELSRREEALRSYPEIWQTMNANTKTGNSLAVWIRQRFKELFTK